ncbi:MAG: hypothetical protein IPN91_15835 [Holophagaceae bacterium]|uniref:Secreted protein n=1 Tax=Candidatus Geothrix odensensis TaxID=2954440 RepID=A0A936F596_9BACT|nr:hypothetical protein [Candidatus Geothrix odensensis]
MSIHSLRQRAASALLALSLGLGLAALHTGCVKNDSSYTDPSPAISNFQVATTVSPFRAILSPALPDPRERRG